MAYKAAQWKILAKIKPKSMLIWKPTMQIRWKKQGNNATLQQLWQADTGEQEWRNIDVYDQP